MPALRYLIVNADDFGQSTGVNRGVIRAHEDGIVTSASLMVRWPAAAAAAAYGREHPRLSLGLHVDLGEWAFLDQRWVPVYEVAPLDDAAALADEVARQVAAFRTLVGKDPTHLDSHQHVHLREPVRTVLTELGRRLGVPLRHFTSDVHYCGGFYGQTAEGTPLPGVLSVGGLLGAIAGTSAPVTELGCHPGEGNDLDSTYRYERAREVAILCDPRLPPALAAMGIGLCSFAPVASRVRR